MPPPRPCRPRRLERPTCVALALASAIAWALVLAVGGAPTAQAASPRWLRPVRGEVVRPFVLGSDPFARGQHRGADFVAAPGARVRSACSGRVAFAGAVPGLGRVVSVRCGGWRVVYGPLASASVRRGGLLLAGARVGTVGTGHRGALHVGVRREVRRFGYVDPLSLIGADGVPPVTVPVPRLGPAPRRTVPRLVLRSPRPVGAPAAAPVPSVAPWPVWLGLGLLATGAAGGATLRPRLRRRAVGERRRERARLPTRSPS